MLGCVCLDSIAMLCSCSVCVCFCVCPSAVRARAVYSDFLPDNLALFLEAWQRQQRLLLRFTTHHRPATQSRTQSITLTHTHTHTHSLIHSRPYEAHRCSQQSDSLIDDQHHLQCLNNVCRRLHIGRGRAHITVMICCTGHCAL